jgi:hypothetical protein
MAASTTQNLSSRSESKSAKKKKGIKTDTGAPTTPAAETATEAIASIGTTENGNGDGSYESPYIKELYK